MATAGELVIKIAADYAELVTGMAEANAKVDAFGKKIDANSSAMARGFAAAATAVKTFVAGLAINEVLAYGQAMEKTIGDMADMAENLKMSVDDFQAFQSSALLAGQSTEAVGAAIGKFNVFIGKAAEGSKEQIEKLNQLGVKILDVNGKLRPQADLLQEVAIKITSMSDASARAAAEVAFFGKSGQSVSAILEQWKKGTEELNRELEAQGLRHLPETIKAMDELSDRAAIGAKRMEVFFAPFYAAAKTAVIEGVASALEAVAKAFGAIGQYDSLIDKLSVFFASLGAFVAGGGAKVDAADFLKGDVDAVTAKIDKLRTKYDELSKSSSSAAASDMAVTIGQIRELEAKRAVLLGKLEAATAPTVTLPAIDVNGKRPGVSNPGVAGAGLDIQEQLNKLAAQEIAARNAMKEFDKSTTGSFDQQRRAIELAKKIQEATGELQAKADKAGVGDAFRESIQRQVSETLKAQDALKQYEQDAQKADEATRRLDDGTKAYNETLEELNRQLKTGRLSQIAYDRAVYQASERQKDQAAELDRFKGGIEGFSAGIEKAARDYAKANDEFAMGGRVFNGFISSIDQGLDVLAGTSNKTFDQIAGDFARMIAKMALQAALSPVFKWIMKGAGSLMGGGGGIDSEIADWSSYGSGGGSGGGIFSFFSGLFGGGRAIGGNVQPGVTYDVGEHGPEKFTPSGVGTITPYSRDNGNVTVNLDMKKAEGARDPASALEFGRKVKAAVTDIITNEKRPGGLLYAN